MIGEAAALTTAVAWAGSSLLFTAASRQRGPAALNLVRLVGATLVLGLAVVVTTGSFTMPRGQALAFALSGIVGLALGDFALFAAMRILGPRRSMLLMALAPVVTAVLMVPLLHEGLGPYGIAGMGVTICGVAWVQAERDDGREVQGRASVGIVLGLCAALGQAVGLVLAKVGVGAAPAGAPLAALFGADPGVAVHPILGTFVRMAAGTLLLLGSALGRGARGRLATALRDPAFLRPALGGTVLGPVVGVSLSLVAVANANTAVAGTILASAPVFVIPLTRVVHGQRASARAWIGAVVALAGVALLSARGELPR